MILKIDKPNEARFLHDLVARDSNTIMKPPNIPDLSRIINSIATYPFRTTINLSDKYYNIRIYPPYEKHTTFVTTRGIYRISVMQQGDSNASATC